MKMPTVRCSSLQIEGGKKMQVKEIGKFIIIPRDISGLFFFFRSLPGKKKKCIGSMASQLRPKSSMLNFFLSVPGGGEVVPASSCWGGGFESSQVEEVLVCSLERSG